MFVGIAYYDEKISGYKADRAYTYQTDMALKVGDKVIAPTAKTPEQRGMVVSVQLPEPPFVCKSIVSYYIPAPVEDAE